MNKKQFIIAWVMVIAISIIILFTPKMLCYENSYLIYDKDNFTPLINWSRILGYSVIVLLIGGLLAYTLKDKK